MTIPHPRKNREQDIVPWIPEPYYSTNSATRTSSSYDTKIRCWKKQGKRMTATVDSPDITLMLWVIWRWYQRLAFEHCTDNKHTGSLKTVFVSLRCGRNVHREEKEEILYKYRRTLTISTVIKQLCPWIHTIMQTESITTFKIKAHISILWSMAVFLKIEEQQGMVSTAFQYLLYIALFTVFSNSYSRCKKEVLQ